MPPRTVGEVLREARARLAAAGCDQPALDARLLLEAAAGLSHSDIAAEPLRLVNDGAQAQFASLVARREAHEPVSRILGFREFYGRRFRVSPAVLDPRPDTETLIGEALKAMKPGCRILDLGTGSGCIIVTLLAECVTCMGVATDLSASALAVARDNAEVLGVSGRLNLVQGNWLAPVEGRFELIVANPPYIPAGDIAQLAPDVRDFDPRGALDGGADGLDAYRRIAAEAGDHLAPGGRVMVEIGAGQAEAIMAVFRDHGLVLQEVARDLGGHVRCLGFSAV